MSVVVPSLRPAIAVPGWAKNELWRKAKAVPSLDLRFADSKSLVDATTGQNLVTFSRGTGGTYFDSQGVLRTALVDEPRFDHDPTTGESLGLLVEEQRQNLLWPSQFTTFGTTAANNIWYETVAELDCTVNNATAPDGSSTAALLAVNSNTSFRAVFNRTGSAATGTLAYSVYCKPASTDNAVRLLIAGEAAVTNYIQANFTLTDAGTASAATVTGTATAPVAPSITAVGNGWYRCVLYASFTGPTNINCLIYPGTTSAQTTASQTLVWGAQLEAGAFPTSYIPTTASAATRAADVANITGINFSSWYRQDEGTVFADVKSAPVNNIAQVTFDISNGTTDERILQRRTTSAFIGLAVVDGGVTQGDIGTSSIDPSARYRSGAAYKLNDLEVVVNGAGSPTDTSATLPTPNRIHIGQNFGSGQACNGHVRRITYWPQRLPDTTLQTITL